MSTHTFIIWLIVLGSITLLTGYINLILWYKEHREGRRLYAEDIPLPLFISYIICGTIFLLLLLVRVLSAVYIVEVQTKTETYKAVDGWIIKGKATEDSTNIGAFYIEKADTVLEIDGKDVICYLTEDGEEHTIE